MFLIIDDNYIDRLVARKILEAHFQNPPIAEVENAQNGITWLQSNAQQALDNIYILLDIRMPEINGFGFLDIFVTLNEDIRKKTQIVMLSSSIDTSDIEQAATYVCVKRLIEKPLNPKQLEALLTI
jgi:CheY-like chemotaxis protein